jgi:hypothetical protein
MKGNITVTYAIICENDVDMELTLDELFANEKVQNLIKREFTKGARNIVLDHSNASGSISLAKEKKLYSLVIGKDDFADALTLAEEDARSKKLLKGGCNRVELIDLETGKG